MRIAREVAGWSKDPGTKVGAVAVSWDRRILSTGYNGLPQGLEDTPERLGDRPYKLAHTVHAELNCILNAARNGVSLKDSLMFVHGLPVCSSCALHVAQAGVRAVVMCVPSAKPDWEESWTRSEKIFREVGVETYTIAPDAVDIL